MRKIAEKEMRAIAKKEVEFCQNCQKKKCNGNCDDIKKFHKELLEKAEIKRLKRVNVNGY